MNSAVLVIGNEVLAGRVKDINSNFLIQKLWDIGLPVKKVEMIPDERDLIVEAVQNLSRKYDYLFVTGGIGATHDDLTREAVSAAMGVACVPHSEAIRLMQEHYAEPLNAHQLEMGNLPENCNLILNPISHAPGFYIKNVFVFPGFPEMIRDMFPSVEKVLPVQQKLSYVSIPTQLRESDFADYLTALSHEVAPEIDLGSYPQLPPSPVKTLISVSGRDEKRVSEVVEKIRRELNV